MEEKRSSCAEPSTQHCSCLRLIEGKISNKPLARRIPEHGVQHLTGAFAPTTEMQPPQGSTSGLAVDYTSLRQGISYANSKETFRQSIGLE
ncbi:hypothetical protein KIL84_020806 [Mauremys mutica]|uniref:Uncharacterized protein n=1 Tax=Mauremys mutica TaxID=74926 RepID=A0A9D3XAT2_9SAUR|nr:hypothetical protein KIL84_020806 [Mauremys mutica]